MYALDGQKSRMAFVHVEHRRLQTHRLQRSQSADSEHDLLPDAHVIVAAIELIGDVAVIRLIVFRDVGVKKVKLDPADLHVPDLDPDHRRWRPDADFQFRPVRLQNRQNRKGVEVVLGVLFRLPSIGVQRLLQIAFLIKQADPYQRQIRVACALHVIA